MLVLGLEHTGILAYLFTDVVEIRAAPFPPFFLLDHYD